MPSPLTMLCVQAEVPDIGDEAILLEQTQRLQHRLARGGERRGKLLLCQPIRANFTA